MVSHFTFQWQPRNQAREIPKDGCPTRAGTRFCYRNRLGKRPSAQRGAICMEPLHRMSLFPQVVKDPSFPKKLESVGRRCQQEPRRAQGRESVRLKLLQQNDERHPWKSLSDRRVCILCGHEFTGNEVLIFAHGGKPTFQCPSPCCHGKLRHFVNPGNPLLSDEIWGDWMRSMADAGAEGCDAADAKTGP